MIFPISKNRNYLYSLIYGFFTSQNRNGGHVKEDGWQERKKSLQLAVIRKDLPKSFDKLLIFVLNEIGQSNSYTTTTASRIRLTVTPIPGQIFGNY